MNPGLIASRRQYRVFTAARYTIVFEGILDLWIDGEKRTLGAGDSFRFPTTKTHPAHNPGNVLTRVVRVTSPPLY
jgi:mannose-6-phosphate isomerase-like protein (cupin superfamily)